MKYLKITFIRILLSFFAANMAISLLTPNNFDASYLLYKIILTVVFYYGLTLYVNNRK